MLQGAPTSEFSDHELDARASGDPQDRHGYYRVLDPTGTVVETKDIESAEDAHAWFVDVRAGNSELGWRMEVQHTDGWSFFDDTEGTR